MWRRDYRDIAAGAFFAAVGGAAAVHAATHYAMGSLRNIGPGMFPAGAGVVLAVFGLAILAPALVRAGPRPHVEPDVAAAVLASIAAFALVVPAFGLVPATVALVVVSRLADRRGRTLARLGLAAGLSVLAWGVFVLALGVPLAAVRWPW
jgi:hypothetical protein